MNLQAYNTFNEWFDNTQSIMAMDLYQHKPYQGRHLVPKDRNIIQLYDKYRDDIYEELYCNEVHELDLDSTEDFIAKAFGYDEQKDPVNCKRSVIWYMCDKRAHTLFTRRQLNS